MLITCLQLSILRVTFLTDATRPVGWPSPDCSCPIWISLPCQQCQSQSAIPRAQACPFPHQTGTWLRTSGLPFMPDALRNSPSDLPNSLPKTDCASIRRKITRVGISSYVSLRFRGRWASRNFSSTGRHVLVRVGMYCSGSGMPDAQLRGKLISRWCIPKKKQHVGFIALSSSGILWFWKKISHNEQPTLIPGNRFKGGRDRSFSTPICF